MSTIFETLSNRRAFIVARIADKHPVNPTQADPSSSWANSDAQDSSTWMLPAEALAHVARLGAGFGVGIVLNPSHKLACVDIDGAYDPATGEWTAIAMQLLEWFTGAYVEISVSGRGLHIIFAYQGDFPAHACKDTAQHIELYHERRYILLTGTSARGNPLQDCTDLALGLVYSHFPATSDDSGVNGEWTDGPLWHVPGTADDTVLLEKMRRSKSMVSIFGGDGVTNAQLLDADADALAKQWPGNNGAAYDASSADLSLANRLMWFTGGDCERTERIMRQSALLRDKWDELEGYYIRRTVLKALHHVAKNPPTDRSAPVSLPLVAPGPPAAPAVVAPLALAVPLGAAMPTPLTVIHNGLLRTNLRYDPIADEENVRLLLENEAHLQGIARFNEFSGELLLVRPITSDTDLVGERGLPRPWTDADTATLQTFIQKHYIPKIAREKIDAIVSMFARQRSAFHPVRDYLQSLAWDGVPRLDTWMRDYWGAAKQPAAYLAAVGAAWMISAVARIMEPGCQADYALVLEGDQGIRKSSALRILAGGEHFSDSLPADLSHKDARDHLRGKWIIELPELAQFKRNEIETVKAFITRLYEQYRPSYGRHEVRFPRQCVFAGSTNDDTYLVDTTGNRRFWVIACARVDLEAMKRDRDQLWAEAAARYRKGERWYLTQEQEAMAAVEAAGRVAHDPWTSQVAHIVVESLKGPDVSPGEVMERMNLPQVERHARNAARVGSILTNLGWRRGKRHMTRGQLYARAIAPPPPGMKL